MKPIALLFSGQGAQRVGMGTDLAEACPAARKVLELGADILPDDFPSVLQSGPEETLTRTAYCQPALYLHGLALLAVLKEKKPDFSFTATAGLSLGEFTAHAAAGTFSAEDGLRLVARRGVLMEEACSQRKGTMLALLGADESLATKVATATGWEVANLNGGGQVVLSGPAEKLEAAQAAAKTAGVKRTIPLKVAGAYHSSLMKPAKEGLTVAIAKTSLKMPSVPVLSNFLGRPASSEDEIRSSLLDQVTGTVRWEACLQDLSARGITHLLELGPGGVLAGLAKKIVPNLPCHSAGTLAELEKVIHDLPR
ncbi:MAG: [acyl-carrier-protein] S-malonyltransferase [Verrucomicrobia bacterium]|nr:[acyl-carrier-protein] S-malonyltransferase [Verrucomicrobiota bacterium]NBS50620.1 [acyl-carrier-protein] S-malonyltransferase [Verrucomicrobiota bacterium]NBS78549.1 [acyl-carrier-protein] S-malonyltransferase [bacterium]